MHITFNTATISALYSLSLQVNHPLLFLEPPPPSSVSCTELCLTSYERSVQF